MAANTGIDFIGLVNLHHLPIRILEKLGGAIRQARNLGGWYDPVKKVYYVLDFGFGSTALRRAGNQFSLGSKQQAEGRRIRLTGIKRVSQPGEVYVQTADRIDLTHFIINRHQIRSKGQGIRTVFVRVGPTGGKGFKNPRILLVPGIIMVRSGYLVHLDAAIRLQAGIRLE